MPFMLDQPIIENAIRRHFASFYKKSLQTTDNLFDRGALDSLGIVGLINYIESELHTVLDPEDITEENFATIESITGLIQNKTK